MKKIRHGLIVLSLLFCSVTYAKAGVSVGIGIGLPNLSIGINLPMLPELSPVPGYPVYYAPQVNGNYFFYDGMYWVYQNDNWYASSWYNGPWSLVEPYAVPLFILRIPVRYYQQPPLYFRGWRSNAPPRWGQHWGRDWEQHRRGWNHWNKKTVQARAPRPTYQKQYAGERYPAVEQQHSLHIQSYRYQSKDKGVRQHLQQQGVQKPHVAIPPQQGRQQSQPLSPAQAAPQHPSRLQLGAPADQHSKPPLRGGVLVQNPKPAQQPQQHAPQLKNQKQQDPRLHDLEQKSQENRDSQDTNRGRGQGRDKDDEHGRGH